MDHSPAFVTGLVAHPASCSAPARRRAQCAVRMGRRSEKIATRKQKGELVKTKLYARTGKMIVAAVRAGGSEPDTNKALADALEYARVNNVPKDNITRAVQRATAKDQADYQELMYEAYAHGGAGLLIEVLTDNNNRAAAEVRGVCNKTGLKLAQPGSVGFNFQRKGIIRVPGNCVHDEDEFLMAAIEAGAEECEPGPESVDSEDGSHEEDEDEPSFTVTTDPTELFSTKKALEVAGYRATSAVITMIPKGTAECSEQDLKKNVRAVDALLGIDDVDSVYENFTAVH